MTDATLTDPVFTALGMSAQAQQPPSMEAMEALARPFDCGAPGPYMSEGDAALAALSACRYQQAFFAHVVAAATAAAAAAAAGFCQESLVLPEVMPSMAMPGAPAYQDFSAMPPMFWGSSSPLSWNAPAWYPTEQALAQEPLKDSPRPSPPGLVAPATPGTPPRRGAGNAGLDVTPPKRRVANMPMNLQPMVLNLSDIVCKNDFAAPVPAEATPGAIILQMLKGGEGVDGKPVTGRRRRRGGRGRGRGGRGQGAAKEAEGDDDSSEEEKGKANKGEDTPSTVASDGDNKEGASKLDSSAGSAALPTAKKASPVSSSSRTAQAARRGKNGEPRVPTSPGSVWI